MKKVLALIIAAMMIVSMIPAFLFALYEKNGQHLEVIIHNMIQVMFLRPKKRPYLTNNFYAAVERQNQLDKEVYRIVRQKKAHPSREEGYRGRYIKGKKDG